MERPTEGGEAEFHQQHRVFTSHQSFEKIRRLFPQVTKMKVLDIGCGNGTIGQELIQQGNFVWGMDINEEAARLSTEKGLKVSLWDSNRTWPYANDFFDVVLATDVLEHLYDWGFIFTEASRVLKANGSFIVVTPNHFDVQSRINILLGRGIVHWSRRKEIPNALAYPHIRFPLLSDITALAASHHLYPDLIVLNFMSGKFPPAIFLPGFVRRSFLTAFPGLYSGKFGIRFTTAKNDTKVIALAKTPKGY